MVVLEVKNLSVSYDGCKTFSVNNISFSISSGEIICLVGESGSGKSTVLKAIASLLPPYASVRGKVLFKGINLLELSQEELNRYRGKEIGFIFQEPSLYLDPLYKVGQQIEETCKIHIGGNCFQKTLTALVKSGVSSPEKVYHMYPHQLSGGLKQRVNIADATVNNPILLLADEPTTALDVSTQKKVLALLKKFKDEGKSILLVTHDFGVVWEIADRVIVMKEGIKIEEGPVGQIYQNPKNPYTQKLINSFKELDMF
jgi:peptide/nickel transport system ATP-binding protein